MSPPKAQPGSQGVQRVNIKSFPCLIRKMKENRMLCPGALSLGSSEGFMDGEDQRRGRRQQLCSKPGLCLGSVFPI